MQQIQYSHKAIDGAEIVTLSGRLMQADTTQLRDILKQLIKQNHFVVINMSGLNFIDSSGLSVLISAFKYARESAGNVVLLQLTPAVRSLIELTRLHQVFDIFDDETQAIAKAKAKI